MHHCTVIVILLQVFRPGFSRLSLPYFMSEEKIDYILRAVEFVAAKGTLFLPFYR
jgi:hypothetical protein